MIKTQNTDQLISKIIDGIEEVKGQNISILDLRDIDNAVTQYFIITEGTSNTQVNAIADSIQKTVSKQIHQKPWHIEGEDKAEWILMDYVDVVVHVMQKPIREYYNLEELWGDAQIMELNNDKDI
jgi:ribosome-associated protein